MERSPRNDELIWNTEALIGRTISKENLKTQEIILRGLI
jgi:hypothetical protein